MDASRVFTRAWDGTQLLVTADGVASAAWPVPASRIDEDAVWTKVYDEATGTVRVVYV